MTLKYIHPRSSQLLLLDSVGIQKLHLCMITPHPPRIVPDMTCNVFGGMLNLAQFNSTDLQSVDRHTIVKCDIILQRCSRCFETKTKCRQLTERKHDETRI